MQLELGRYKSIFIHGQLYYMSKSLSNLDENPENASYTQFYLYDSICVNVKRSKENPGLKQSLFKQLTALLHQNNLFIGLYKTVYKHI